MEITEKKNKKRRGKSYERRKQTYGYFFIAIWMIGTIYMFLMPIGESIWYSLCDTTLVGAGDIEKFDMSAPGIKTAWNDFGHYKDAFLTSGDFTVELAASLINTIPKAAMTLIFSMFTAVLLSQKFRGRTFFRAIFFLPVLIATGPVISVINGDMASSGTMEASQFDTLFKVDLVSAVMNILGLNNIGQGFIDVVQGVTADIFGLIWKSGIQILIFLSALSQIPVSSREAAEVEGATGWEFFWKVSLPTISPMILAALVYTVIDTFVDFDNNVMRLVMQQVDQLNYGYSAALAWIYFAIVAVALVIIMGIASRFVTYDN